MSTISPRHPRIAAMTDPIGRGQDRICSIEGCGRFSGTHKRCFAHLGYARSSLGVFDLIEQEWTDVVVTARVGCVHEPDWADCGACTSEADFDRGVL